MERIEKTVFLCYRRSNAPWALVIFKDLTHHGYDVFFDYNGIASGDFENVILGNITARAHFLVLLTPSALERCDDPADWLRREIETALDGQRNIVPLMLEGFDFGAPGIASGLTGKLALLKNYNGMSVSVEYFDAAMQRLRERYLNVPLTAVLHPASLFAQRAAAEQKAAADAAPAVPDEELTAQQWFERGTAAAYFDEKLRFLSEALRLKPDFPKALFNRAIARRAQGDVEGALQDYNEAIRLKPDFAEAFNNRGIARAAKGDLGGALQDLAEAIRLKPNSADAFANRGALREAKKDFDGALVDCSEAIRLRPDFAGAFYTRGGVRRKKGDLDGALQDYNEATRLKPDFAEAFNERGLARQDKEDLEGALQDYNEALRLKPDFGNAFLNRSHARAIKGGETDLDGTLRELAEFILRNTATKKPTT